MFRFNWLFIIIIIASTIIIINIFIKVDSNMFSAVSIYLKPSELLLFFMLLVL